MKLRFFLLLTAGLISVTTSTLFAGKFEAEDYKKALWMATRFYGAQRCGEGPNWLTMGHGVYDDKCHVKDCDGDYDLSGGWHDCGDHVKFGQTEFYSAWALLTAYDAFPEGFDDKYSMDYSGYVENDAWGYNDGKPNGIPDVLDEVRYVMDYFMKCVRDDSKFYYQISDKGHDHNLWVTSPYQSTLKVAEGGEKDGTRVVYSTSNGAKGMSAEAAAAMAMFARVYEKYDADYSKKVLEKAKVAYEYAKKASSTTGSAGGDQYPATDMKSATASLAGAASHLYMATGEESYKSEAKKYDIEYSYWVLCYNNPQELAFYAVNRAGVDADGADELEFVTDEYKKQTDGNGIYNGGDRTWGPIRYNSNVSFASSLSDAANNSKSKFDWVRKQIDFILGDNSGNFSYVVGFGDKYPEHPHHRNYFWNDKNVEKKNSLTPPDKNKYLGMLIGGNNNQPGSYNDDVDNYYGSEGGIDYNAGLVGALAYLISELSPIDTSDFSYAVADAEVVADELSVNAYPNPFNPVVNLAISLNEASVKSAKIYNLKGEVVKNFKTNSLVQGNNNLTWNASKMSSGIYFFKLTTASGAVSSKKLILLK